MNVTLRCLQVNAVRLLVCSRTIHSTSLRIQFVKCNGKYTLMWVKAMIGKESHVSHYDY